jgi:acetylglutamate kinase
MSDITKRIAATQARLLAEALPFMQRYENKTVVVKYGGHAMGNASSSARPLRRISPC